MEIRDWFFFVLVLKFVRHHIKVKRSVFEYKSEIEGRSMGWRYMF